MSFKVQKSWRVCNEFCPLRQTIPHFAWLAMRLELAFVRERLTALVESTDRSQIQILLVARRAVDHVPPLFIAIYVFVPR